MTFKTNWTPGELGHSAVHNQIGVTLNRLREVSGTDTAALQSSFNAGLGYLPVAEYHVTGEIVIPSNMVIHGDGDNTIIHIDGITDNNEVVYHAFHLQDNATAIEFRNLKFIGSHVEGGGVVGSNWSSVIRKFNTPFNRIKIIDCTFENIVGFPISLGDGQSVHVSGCRFVNCRGGININADRTRIVHNEFDHVMGVECSGSGLDISHNIFNDTLGNSTISAGGYISPTILKSNITIIGNTIKDSVNLAIGVAECAENVAIIGNTIQRVTGVQSFGVVVNSSGAEYKNRKIIIAHNPVVGAWAGIYIKANAGATSDVTVSGNQVGLLDPLLNDVDYGAIIECPETRLIGNVLRGAAKDLTLAASATNVRLLGNDIRAGYLNMDAGASLAPVDFIVSDESDGNLYRIVVDNGVLEAILIGEYQ